MKALSRSYVWWLTIDRDLELLVKSCEPCIEVKSVPPSVDLHPLMWPSRPWKCIHVDFVGPISDKTYLVVVDGYSKWPEVWEMTSTTTEKLSWFYLIYLLCMGYRTS